MTDNVDIDLKGRPHALYRFWNGDTLLYVGITVALTRRWGRHSEDKPWWSEVERATVEHFPDRPSVLAAEAHAIRTENPKYNVRGRSLPTRTKVAMSADGPEITRADRLSAMARADFLPDSLVGSFFLTDSTLGMQGCVVAEVAPSVYMIETFSWVMGDSYEQKLIRLEDMLTWSFYDDADWMRSSYDHGVATRWERERKEIDSMP